MDVKTLLAETKARFNHNQAKNYLSEKYKNKLTIAEQGGLWQADPQTISFLNSLETEKCVLVDVFCNPIEVDRISLLNKLRETYSSVMKDWCDEYKSLENKR